jgi:predicted GNAT family acetyltransferase
VEWEHSAITVDDADLFGCRVGDEIVAIAKYSMKSPDAAWLGVVTHPGFRGKGYGKAVVSAAMSDAFDLGHFVLYQTLLSNAPSVGLARSLGIREYAQHVAVRLKMDTSAR